MRPQSRLAGSQNCGAIFQHLKLDMTLGFLKGLMPYTGSTILFRKFKYQQKKA
jgi:hypothetical protein